MAKAEASVGTDTDKRESVRVTVRGGMLKARDDILITARNAGHAEAVVQKGWTVSAIGVDVTKLPTMSYYDTAVSILDDAQLVSEEGSVDILSSDKPVARSVAKGTNIGFLVDAEKTRGENTLYTNNYLTVQAFISAYEALRIRAMSSVTMIAQTEANGGGFFSGKRLYAENTLDRNVRVTVSDGSELRSDYGDITVAAVAGENDWLVSWARVTSGGVVSLGEAEARTVNTTLAYLTVGKVNIYDRYNTVNLYVDTPVPKMHTTAYANCSGLGVHPEAYASNYLFLSALNSLNGGAPGSDGAIIEARHVNINTFVSKMDAYALTYAKGKALGANVDARSTNDFVILSQVDVSNADITGHDSTTIYASTLPEYLEKNIHSDSRIQLDAVGDGYARSYVHRQFQSNTRINSGVTFRGAQLTVTAYEIPGARIAMSEHTGGFIRKHTSDGGTDDIRRSAEIADGTILYLGDAAAGIHFDISIYHGQLLIRQVGVKREAVIWTVAGDDISFAPIVNQLPGYAFLGDCTKIGALTVYDQAWIPAVTFTNRTDKNIILSSVTPQNTGYIMPRVITRDAAPTAVDLRKHPAGSDFLVENWLDGDVAVQGFLPFYNGSVEFRWIGETGGALTGCDYVVDVNLAGEAGDVTGGQVAPIWAHTLSIVNAGSVGTADQDLKAYVFANRDEADQVLDGLVNVGASGDIHLYIKPLIAEVVPAASMPANGAMGDSSPDDSRVDIHEVVSTEGSVYLTLDVAARLYIKLDTVTVAIPVPDTVSYIYASTELTTLTANAELDGMDLLSRYVQHYDPMSGAYTYLLPNGVVLYIDAQGNVIRVEENGTTLDVGDYEFVDANHVRLTEGIDIDLQTGEINVQDGTAYEVLLSALLGDRFLADLRSGAITIRVVQSDYTENADGSLTLNSATEREMTLKQLAANDQYNGYMGFPRTRFKYYYFSELRPSVEKISAGEVCYLVVHDTETNSVRLFAMDSTATQYSGDTVEDFLYNYSEGSGESSHMVPIGTVTVNGKSYYLVDNETPVAHGGHEFIVDDFLGSGIQVYILNDDVPRIYLTTLEQSFVDPSIWYIVPDVLDESHALYVINLSNGMFTVPWELGHEFDPTNPADVFWQKMQGKIWSYSEEASVLTSARQILSVGNADAYPRIPANGPDGVSYALAMKDGESYYVLNTTLYSYELLVHFTDLTEVSASLTGEYDATGLACSTDTPNLELRQEGGESYLYNTSTHEQDAVVSQEIVPDATGLWSIEHEAIINGSAQNVTFTWTASNRLGEDSDYVYYTASYSIPGAGDEESSPCCNIIVRVAKGDEGTLDPANPDSYDRSHSADVVRYNASTESYELVRSGATAVEGFEDRGRRRVTTASGIVAEYNINDAHEYATASDIESSRLVFRVGGAPEDGRGAMLSVEGPVLDTLYARPQQVSTSQYEGLAYQIYDTLYLTGDGRVLSINGSFSAIYDGETYTSDNTILSHMGTVGVTQENDPHVVLRAGGKVYKEQLSDHVATDVTGRYYFCADGETNWTAIDPADVLNGFGNYPYIDSNGANAVITPAVLTHDGADTVVAAVMQYDIPFLTITSSPDGILYYTIPVFQGGELAGYVRAGSDGTVERLDDRTPAHVMTETPGVDYLLTSVSAAEEVVITILDPDAHLTDNDPSGSDGIDINAGSDGHPGSITFVTDGGEGSIGKPDNDIEIDTHGGTVSFETTDGEKIVKNDTYIYIPENDVVLAPIILDDAILQLVTGDGSIEGGSVTVINGGNGIFFTDRDDDPPHNTERDHDTAPSDGNISFTKVTVDGDSSLTIEGRGDVSLGDTSVTDNSKLNVVSSEGDFHGENLGVTDGSTVNISAAKDVDLYQIRCVDGTVTITAGEDLRFDNAIVRRSELNLTAGDTLGMREGGGTLCGEYGQRNFIQVDQDDTDATSHISLSAAGQLGEEDNRLIVDIPEAVTLYVPTVGDMYVDSLTLFPRVEREGEVRDVRITADDLCYDLIKPVAHPDNPQENEYSGVEVGTGEDVTGDLLAHIRDEKHASELPFQTSDEIAAAIVDRKGSDWADGLDEDAVKALIGDEHANETILSAISDDTVTRTLEGMRSTEKPVSDTDRAIADWIIRNNPGYEELAARIDAGETLTDDEISALLTGFTPAPGGEQDWRNAQMAAILSTPDEHGDLNGAAELLSALKTSTDDGEKQALLSALLEIQTADGSTEQPFSDLVGLVGELLTDEEKEALKHQALLDSEMPPEASGGYTDPESKPIHVEIGQSTGNTNLYNDGSIDITVTGTSDLIVELIESERGDVKIDVQDGSILAGGDQEQNILGANIDLHASGSIGTESDPLKLQQRDNQPTVAVQVRDETPSGEQTGTVRRDENGNWVMDTAVSFDWIRKDVEDATMRLDATADTGDIALTEIEGGTGVGVISAPGGDVILNTDGDVTDVRSDAEKAADVENITSGGDTTVNAPNGQVGTADDPIDVNVGGHMTVDDKDDIHVTSNEDLAITADTQDGIVNVHSDQDLALDNTSNAAHGTGDMVIQEATAGGDATVNVSGNLTGSTETDSDGNETVKPSVVSAGGSADVTAGGEIRDTNVTADDDHNGSGSASATANGGNVTDTNVSAGENATVTAHSGGTDETRGDVDHTNVTAGGTATVNADGDVNTSDGALFQGDNVNVNADTDHDGDGSVGSADKPVQVDTASGTSGSGALGATGAEVFVEEQSGDLALSEITATEGDAEITAPGSVTDANTGSPVQDAADAAKAASDAQNLADAAADEADVLDKHAARLEDEAAQARADANAAAADAAAAAAEAAAKDSIATAAETAATQAAQDAQDVRDDIAAIDHQIDVVKADTGLTEEEKQQQIEVLENQKEVLEQKLAEKEQAAAEAKAEADALRAEADKAAAEAAALQTIANDKDAVATGKEADAASARADANTAAADAAAAQTAADAAKSAAESAANNADASDPTVETTGDLTIHSGGDVGTVGDPLDTAVGGELILDAPGDVAIANQGDLHIGDLDAGDNADPNRDVQISVLGDLESDDVITGGSAEINASGDVGSADKPIETDVDKLSGTIGGDADLVNHGDLTVDDLSVGGDLTLDVEGDLHGGDAAPGTANITAGTADISADGNVGDSGDPLELAVDEINIDGDNVDVHAIHDITIDKITGDDVTVSVDGEIYAGDEPINVISDNLTLDTTGGIAEEDKPLYVYIPGDLIVNNHTDDAYVINLYKKPGGDDDGTGNGRNQNKLGENDDWSALGTIVFHRDWSEAPALLTELVREKSADGAVTLRSVGGLGVKLAGKGIERLNDGRILGVIALDDSGSGVAKSFRYLRLTAQTRRALLETGIRFLVFRVGDRALVIDLTQLGALGTYDFSLDPEAEGEIAAVMLDGIELARLHTDGSATGDGAIALAVLLLTAGDAD